MQTIDIVKHNSAALRHRSRLGLISTVGNRCFRHPYKNRTDSQPMSNFKLRKTINIARNKEKCSNDEDKGPHHNQRAYHPTRQLRLGSGKIIRRNRKEIGKIKDETYMQDLREMSIRLESCACSYGTSSMSLTSKTNHTHYSYA